jgi:hypothetical protein
LVLVKYYFAVSYKKQKKYFIGTSVDFSTRILIIEVRNGACKNCYNKECRVILMMTKKQTSCYAVSFADTVARQAMAIDIAKSAPCLNIRYSL